MAETEYAKNGYEDDDLKAVLERHEEIDAECETIMARARGDVSALRAKQKALKKEARDDLGIPRGVLLPLLKRRALMGGSILASIGWWLVGRFDDLPRENVIETWAKEEYRPGVSAGAAARQLCRSLGAYDRAPTLKRMLETMLSESNFASFDRHLLIEDFKKIDEAAGHDAEMRSFRRINKIDDPASDAVH